MVLMRLQKRKERCSLMGSAWGEFHAEPHDPIGKRSFQRVMKLPFCWSIDLVHRAAEDLHAAKDSFSCDRRSLELDFATASGQLSTTHLTDRWRWDIAHSTRIHSIGRIIIVLACQWKASDDTTSRNPLIECFEPSALGARFVGGGFLRHGLTSVITQV